jgi:hypothetical protein
MELEGGGKEEKRWRKKLWKDVARNGPKRLIRITVFAVAL